MNDIPSDSSDISTWSASQSSDMPMAAAPSVEPNVDDSAAAGRGPRLPGSRQTVWLVCALLALAVVVVFCQTGRHEFVNFDDDRYVYDDPYVKSGLTWHNLGYYAIHYHGYTYHPLTTLSHMIDCQLFGVDPGKHHWVNLVIHAVTAVGLFLVLRLMTRRLWPAAAVAAVFAVHPLRVESVAWISERKDVLSGLFFVLTLWAYTRYARRPQSLGRYLVLCVFFTLGLLAKPMLVTVPLVLLLVDYWPLGRWRATGFGWRSVQQLLTEKIPLFALALINGGITLHTQVNGGAVQPLDIVSWPARIANTPIAYANYLGCFFWPQNLAVLYPHPLNSFNAFQAVGKASLLAYITIAAVLLCRRMPYLIVGWLWYLIMLVPVIGLLQVGGQAMADRYTYLPQIGLAIAVVWSIADMLKAISPTRNAAAGPSLALRCGLCVATIGVFAALTVAAWRQTGFWRDSVTLWARDMMYSNATQLYDFGLALDERGRHHEAIEQYMAALRIDSGDVATLHALGLSYEALNDTEAAARQYRTILEIDPKSTVAQNGLARLAEKEEKEAEISSGVVKESQPTTAESKGSGQSSPPPKGSAPVAAITARAKKKPKELAAVTKEPDAKESRQTGKNADPTPSRENYLPNPGFEKGLKYWDLYQSPNGNGALDDKVSHSGKNSLRLEFHKDADPRLSHDLYAANQIGAVLKPGRVYTLSGWIKIAGVPPGRSGPRASIGEVHDPDIHSPFLSGNTDPSKNDGWVFVSVRYTARRDVVAHQFRCQCDAPPDGMAGAAWFDDLKLEEGIEPSAYRPDWVDPGDLYSQEEQIPWLPVPLDFRSSLAVVTPHLELARPYAGGSPRVLWAGFYNNARVGCELAERGDLTLDSVVFNGSSTDRTPVRTLHQKCVEVFRQRLGVEPKLPPEQAPQVLVIEQGTLELLNQQDRARIVDRIASGMGCVVLLGPIHVADHPGAVPTAKIQELIRAAEKLPQPGRGRVVTALNIDQHPLWTHGISGIETVYSDMLHAVYRSQGKPLAEARASLLPQQPLANKAWTASVFGRADRVRLCVARDLPLGHLSLMDGYGATAARSIVFETEAKADPIEAGTIHCPMQPLPGGDYLLEAQLLDGQKRVLAWTLVPFTVRSTVEIVKLDAGAAAFAPNEPLEVACTVKNGDRALPNARLVTQLDDFHGRVLARSNVPWPVPRGETTRRVALDLAHAEFSSVRLQLLIVVDKAVEAQRTLWLSSERLMPRVDFHVGPYDDFAAGWSALGADMTVGPPQPELALRPFPWIDIFGGMGADATLCDAASLEKATRFVVSSLASVEPWTVVGCILHDEVNSVGFTAPPKPAEIEFFRRYLRETYKDIKALNASWATNYSDWSAIDLEPTKIRFVVQSGRSPAPWADWHAASEQAAHSFYAALDQGVHRSVPTARIGPSGTRDSNGVNGADWWLLAHDFRSVCLYNGVHDEMYRSFAPAGRVMTNWSHLTEVLDNPDALRVRIWQDLLAQCDGAPVYGGRYSNVFYPDYRPKPGLLGYAAELAAVRDGIGRLILGAARNDGAAAIFYSPACYRARIVDMKDDGHDTASAEQNNRLAAISAALADLRIGSHFIAYEQVARGELDPRKTKVLLLWGALALSDTEAASIRRYLDEGGIVIADSQPGLYDEHCHRRTVAALDDCCPPSGATGRQVGKGKFLLYPDLGAGYLKARGYAYEGTAEPTAGVEVLRTLSPLCALLADRAGLESSFRLMDARGRDVGPGVTAVDFTDGPARYVACAVPGTFGKTQHAQLLIAAPERTHLAPRDVTAAGHLYECRTGKYFGESRAAVAQDVDLREATGSVFAMLPYRVQRLDITAPARATLGSPMDVDVSLVAAAKPFARHVIVLQLRRPDGRELPEHRWIVETNNGRAAARLHLALNDPVGNWTLTARDVATGVRQTAAIEIQAAAAE